jgi:hypothetical protein
LERNILAEKIADADTLKKINEVLKTLLKQQVVLAKNLLNLTNKIYYMNTVKVKPPKWAIICILSGAVCAFAAAAFTFSQNGKYAMVCGVAALVLYITASVGIGIHKKQQSKN